MFIHIRLYLHPTYIKRGSHTRGTLNIETTINLKIMLRIKTKWEIIVGWLECGRATILGVPLSTKYLITKVSDTLALRLVLVENDSQTQRLCVWIRLWKSGRCCYTIVTHFAAQRCYIGDSHTSCLFLVTLGFEPMKNRTETKAWQTEGNWLDWCSKKLRDTSHARGAKWTRCWSWLR